MTTGPPTEPGCSPVDLFCQGRELAGDALDDAIQNMADAVLEALGKGLASLGTLWVNVGTPNLTTSTGGATPSDAVGFIQGSLWWYMAAAAVLAVIVGGARMAWEQRAEPGREVLKGLLTLTVVASAGLTAIALLVQAADGFSQWIIDRSTTGTDFGQNIATMIGLSSATAPALGPLIVIILGLVALCASFVQIALMVVRGGMLVILAGIFPLSASFTSTEMGRAWFRRCIAWLLAFILYKPAAAIVYATAFRLTGSDVFGDDGLGSVVTGVVLMLLALVALPALMRFVTPMVASTAGGSSGGAAAAGALAAMPTGAIPTGGGRGGESTSPGVPRQGTGSSTPGSSGPSGVDGVSGQKAATTTAGSSGAPTAGAGSGATAAGGAGAGGGAGGGAGAGAAGAGAGAAGAGAGAGAAAAAGPVGIGVAAIATGADVAKKAGQAGAGAARSAAQDSTEGGPSGSR